jgi:WD40 repeat protein
VRFSCFIFISFAVCGRFHSPFPFISFRLTFLFISHSLHHSIVFQRDQTLTRKTTHSGHTNEVNQIKCNAAGTHLVSCADDMTARVWRVRGDDGSSSSTLTAAMSSGEPGTAETAVVLIGHKHSVTSVGWCPDADRPAGTNEIIAT